MKNARFHETKVLGISMPMILRIGLLVLIIASFAIIDPSFVRARNIFAITQTFALLGLVALGLYLTMLAGEFDLSSGAMVAVAGLITLLAGQDNLLTGLVCALAFGLAVGLINAGLMTYLRVSSLVVTLGVMMTLNGLAYWLAGGRVISTDQFDLGFWLDDPHFSVISIRCLITVAAYVLIAAALCFSRVGRDTRAIGSKREVAGASGASVGIALAFAFGFSSVSAAAAGGLLSLSLASASATTGSTLMLQAVSAAIVGGVSLAGGSGKPSGVLVGTLILATLNNGLSLVGLGAAAVLLSNGFVLLLVVLLDGQLGTFIREHFSSPKVPAR
jgi:ribose/xylose/arabinose/galactoside ABC-type transport system permease subunit